jgi:uncharacterized membrane protein YhhN
MKKINLWLHLIIIPIFVVELISRLNNFHTLDYFTKPLLLIWIGLYFYQNTGNIKRDKFIYRAFFFSWIGDLFLMVSHIDGLFFYAGVGGFFLAQLNYIKVFTSDIRSDNKGLVFNNPVWLIPFVVYLAAILYLILGGMKGVMIPIIIIYALSLISMSAFALNRKGLVSAKSFNLVFFGSLLFVLSDSMIAINRFYTEFSGSSFLIMLTYFTAQYLIMQGLIEDKRQK